MSNPPSYHKTDTLSSVTLNEATQYHLSLTLELLRGCQFNCAGCHVNTEAAETMTQERADGLLDWINEMEYEGDYLPTILFVGPTDFLSASNALEVLTDYNVTRVINRFKRLSLQTTLLDISNAKRLGDELKKYYGHMELEINFILEPKPIGNQKYIDTLKSNLEELKRIFDWRKPILSFCIMNVYAYEQSKKGDVKKILADYKALNDRVKELFNTTIDFNFSVVRKEWMEPTQIEEDIRRVSKIFDEGVNTDVNQTVRFSFGKLTDSLIEKHYNWMNGELYVSPLLYERVASFDDKLRIPKGHRWCQWTLESTEEFEKKLLLDQYHGVKDKPDCTTCRYQASCIDRNILTVMDMYDIKECIIARKALDSINVI